MKRLAILIIALTIFSCNNQSDKNTTTINTVAAEPIQSEKSEISEKRDTTTAYKQDTITTANNQVFTNQPANKIKSTQSSESFKGFANFYRQFEQPTQTFVIDASEENTLTCKEGTKITIGSNSFITETNKPVEGEIQVQVREYYKTSDMLLANLTTTSNNDILETGGMLYIEVFSDGEKCELKEDSTMDISFPTDDKKEDMKLFNGSWTSEKINWTLEETEPLQERETEVFSIVETMPEFPGGQKKLWDYFSDNIEYTQTARDNRFQGTVYIGFTVNENGETEDIRIIRGIDSTLNRVVYSAVEQMPKWIPGKQRGDNVKVRMTFPFRFSIEGDSFRTNNTAFKKEFEENVNDNNMSETQMSDISKYIFSTSKLGWINCDRFFRDNRPKVNYYVNIGKSTEIDIKIVFDNINSILTGTKRGTNYTFDQVPIGHSVTLVALKYENDQYYLAIKKTKITREGEPTLEFEPVTMTRLKTAMKNLNRI